MTLEAHRKRENVAAMLRGEAAELEKPKPSEAFRILSSLERPSEVVGYPRFTADGEPVFRFRMRILTSQELDQAAAAADAYTRRILKDRHKFTSADIAEMRSESWREIFDNARLVELLYIACRDEENPKEPLFTTPDDLRKLCTADEQAQLFHTYIAVQERYGPLWRMLDEDEIDKWIDRLTAGVDSYPLADLGQGVLIQLVVSLAFRLASLRTGIGFAGLHSDAGVNDTIPSPTDTEPTTEIPPLNPPNCS